MSLIIAGERSGTGKTTITLALLAYLRRQGWQVQSFKVGPDYIDPMFHQYVTGRACRNLDSILTSETYIRQCFNLHARRAECAVVEGVMGLFDGARKQTAVSKQIQDGKGDNLIADFGSTAHIARLLNLPVLLVLDCSRLSGSIAAIALGYQTLNPQVKLAGLVLNRVGSDRHLELLQEALEPLHIPILGVWRRQDRITIPDRHLGLVPTAELTQLDDLIERLTHLAATCFDWQQLLPLLKVDQIQNSKFKIQNSKFQLTKIALAQDRAFSFYYADNLDLLTELGAEILPWSPLADSQLPEGTQGLYFGGGFPEIFAQELSTNLPALQAVKKAIASGMPVYAECGGLMYLCQSIVDFESKSWQMVGVLPTSAIMGSRLTLGYRQAVALQNSPLLTAGKQIWGHEFHHSHLSVLPNQPLFEILDSHQPIQEGWQIAQIHASYIHLHWGATPELAAKFISESWEYFQHQERKI